jgi:hypothetical protein
LGKIFAIFETDKELKFNLYKLYKSTGKSSNPIDKQMKNMEIQITDRED